MSPAHARLLLRWRLGETPRVTSDTPLRSPSTIAAPRCPLDALHSQLRGQVPGAARRFHFRAGCEAPSAFAAPPIRGFSGAGCRAALSRDADSTAAHCYATTAARRHIGAEPKP